MQFQMINNVVVMVDSYKIKSESVHQLNFFLVIEKVNFPASTKNDSLIFQTANVHRTTLKQHKMMKVMHKL